MDSEAKTATVLAAPTALVRDEAAVTSHFNTFYRESFGFVFRATLAFCSSRDVAFDATQEAFSRALVRWRHVRDVTSPRGWVLTTAINASKRYARRERTPRAVDAPRVAIAPSADRVDIAAALRSLPARRRQAVVLYYLADYPISLVAELMDVSEGAVKAHLSNARKTLKHNLSAFDENTRK